MPSPLKVPFAPDALRTAADTFGTPTYVYHAPTVRERIARLRRHLTGVPVRLLYAMKANSNPAILQIIRQEGLGLDAVSPGELLLALRLGFAPDQILFSANNMTDDEMHLAHERGVLLNIGELSRLHKYGRAYPGADVCVRLNPQVGAGHHEHVVTAGNRSKFGIPVEQADRIRAIAAEHNLTIVGLHHHIGSGILQTVRFWEAARVLLDVARQFGPLRFINLGGGLGIPYRPDDTPLDLDNFRDTLIAPLRAFRDQYGSEALTFWFEPGRYLVGEAGVLLVRVNTLKPANGRTFAGTDSGMGHLVRPAMYGAYHALYNLSNPDGALQPYDVTGNICESGDLFARDRLVQTIREGDILAILDTGAYGMSMGSTYNLRALPAEVLIDEAGPTLIRPRQHPEALVEALLQESGAPR